MDPRADNIGYLINKCAHQLKWDLGKRLLPYDITLPQWAVLRDLRDQELRDPALQHNTPAAIAERLHADRPTISGILDRLSRKDLITSRPNPADRRSQLIELTSSGRDLIPAVEQESDATIDKAMRGFTGSQRESLASMLQQMIANIHAEE